MYLIKDHYWTLEDVHEIHAAVSWEDIASICIRVLSRMPHEPPISLFCGPLFTGEFYDFHKNLELLSVCTEILQKKGVNVYDLTPLHIASWNTIDLWRKKNNQVYCRPLLEVVYKKLLQTGYVRYIYMLSNWEYSRETCWITYMAARLSIEVRDVSPCLYA